MPLPLSRTENSTRAAPISRETISTYPRSVNLRALVVRLSSTRLRATGCPSRSSLVGGSSRTVSCFSSAIGRTMSLTESRIALTEKGTGSRSTSSSPPRASSMMSLATELRPSAAL